MEVAEMNKDIELLKYVEDAISKGMEYGEYRKLVQYLAEKGQTTGPKQEEALINYTQLNDRRMNRWDKTLKVPQEAADRIAQIDKKLLFLVLTESWCGDASPSLPVMNKVAELNSNINLKVVLRDENPELMNRFLTNGAMSIPKLIVVDAIANTVIGEWGPRPKEAAKMVEDYKTEHGELTAEFRQDLQVWYNKNKGQNILRELIELLALK